MSEFTHNKLFTEGPNLSLAVAPKDLMHLPSQDLAERDLMEAARPVDVFHSRNHSHHSALEAFQRRALRGESSPQLKLT